VFLMVLLTVVIVSAGFALIFGEFWKNDSSGKRENAPLIFGAGLLILGVALACTIYYKPRPLPPGQILRPQVDTSVVSGVTGSVTM
jgi:hypothetical protein